MRRRWNNIIHVIAADNIEIITEETDRNVTQLATVAFLFIDFDISRKHRKGSGKQLCDAVVAQNTFVGTQRQYYDHGGYAYCR